MFALNSKTLVCAYGRDGSVEGVFERLLYMCLSNYSKSYVYGALLDLPSSVCYRQMQDYEIEEKAKKYLAMLKNQVSGSFFCAIRQRRYSPKNKYLYCCEDGAMGALRALWRFVNGKKEELIPINGFELGDEQISAAQRIYFSVQDEKTNLFNCIEPNGIFKLAEHAEDAKVVFPVRCEAYSCNKPRFKLGAAFKRTRQSEFGEIEGLYGAGALDLLLSEGADIGAIRSDTVDDVRIFYSSQTGYYFLESNVKKSVNIR